MYKWPFLSKEGDSSDSDGLDSSGSDDDDRWPDHEQTRKRRETDPFFQSNLKGDIFAELIAQEEKKLLSGGGFKKKRPRYFESYRQQAEKGRNDRFSEYVAEQMEGGTLPTFDCSIGASNSTRFSAEETVESATKGFLGFKDMIQREKLTELPGELPSDLQNDPATDPAGPEKKKKKRRKRRKKKKAWEKDSEEALLEALQARFEEAGRSPRIVYRPRISPQWLARVTRSLVRDGPPG